MDQKQKNKLIDAGLVYMVCLLATGLICTLTLPHIGMWAVVIAATLDIAVVIAATKLGHIRPAAIFCYGRTPAKTTLACALFYAAALLMSLPVILFGELLVPGFAATTFKLSDHATLSDWWLILLALILAAYAYALLFEGYVYTRTRKLGRGVLPLVLTAVAAGVFRLDLYIMLPVMLLEGAMLISRRLSGSLIMPTALQFFSSLYLLALTEVGSKIDGTLASEMGATQVCGLSLICISAAITVVFCAMGLVGTLKKLTSAKKLALIITAVVTLAIGCAVASVQ